MKDVLVDGEKIGRTWCRNCALRSVRFYCWKKGITTNPQSLKRGMKETPEAFNFVTERK